MNLKNISVGGGLALVALAVVVNAGVSLITAFSTQAHAGTGAVGNAVVAAAVGQSGGEPTIVWYQAVRAGSEHSLFRAWSDGRVEVTSGSFWADSPSSCIQWRVGVHNDNRPLCQTWQLVSSPNDGLAAFADINADQKVDAQDLSQVLSRWGDAPRNDIPPSDCPLNLINP